MEDVVKDEGFESSSLIQQFLRNKSYHMEREEFKRTELKKDAAIDAFHEHESPVQGRLSPQTKEKIYRQYLMGTTVNDLSLQYGILP
jgi:hypothetical protein